MEIFEGQGIRRAAEGRGLGLGADLPERLQELPRKEN